MVCACAPPHLMFFARQGRNISFNAEWTLLSISENDWLPLAFSKRARGDERTWGAVMSGLLCDGEINGVYLFDADDSAWAAAASYGFAGRSALVNWPGIEAAEGAYDLSRIKQLVDDAVDGQYRLMLRHPGMIAAPRTEWLNTATGVPTLLLDDGTGSAPIPDWFSNNVYIDALAALCDQIRSVIDYPGTPVKYFSPGWLGIWSDEPMNRHINGGSPSHQANRLALCDAGYTAETDFAQHVALVAALAAQSWSHVDFLFPVDSPWVSLDCITGTSSVEPAGMTDRTAEVSAKLPAAFANLRVRDIDNYAGTPPAPNAYGWDPDTTCPSFADPCVFPHLAALRDAGHRLHAKIGSGGELSGSDTEALDAAVRSANVYGATSIEVSADQLAVNTGPLSPADIGSITAAIGGETS